MHNLQPRQLGHDSLLNMNSYPLPEGPPFVNHWKFQEDFEVALVIDVAGMATTGRIWAESQKIPLSLGKFEPAT